MAKSKDKDYPLKTRHALDFLEDHIDRFKASAAKHELDAKRSEGRAIKHQNEIDKLEKELKEVEDALNAIGGVGAEAGLQHLKDQIDWQASLARGERMDAEKYKKKCKRNRSTYETLDG